MDWLPEVVLTMFGKSAAFKYAEIPLSRDSAFFEAQQSPVSHCPFTNSFNKVGSPAEIVPTTKFRPTSC